MFYYGFEWRRWSVVVYGGYRGIERYLELVFAWGFDGGLRLLHEDGFETVWVDKGYFILRHDARRLWHVQPVIYYALLEDVDGYYFNVQAYRHRRFDRGSPHLGFDDRLERRNIVDFYVGLLIRSLFYADCYRNDCLLAWFFTDEVSFLVGDFFDLLAGALAFDHDLDADFFSRLHYAAIHLFSRLDHLYFDHVGLLLCLHLYVNGIDFHFFYYVWTVDSFTLALAGHVS